MITKNLLMVFGLIVGMSCGGQSFAADQATAEAKIAEATAIRYAIGPIHIDISELQPLCAAARDGGEYRTSVFTAIADAVARAEGHLTLGERYAWRDAMLARVDAADAMVVEAEGDLYYGETVFGTGFGYECSASFMRNLAPYLYTWDAVYDDACAARAWLNISKAAHEMTKWGYVDARNEFDDIWADAEAFYP